MKKIKILMVLAWILIMTSPAFAVSDLSVSGITGTYSAANGRYVFQSVDSHGYNIWKHQSANYYIYEYYDGIQPWWLIDNDTNDGNRYLFYDSQGGLSSPTDPAVIWNFDLGEGNPAVAYYSVNPEINISGNGASIVSGDNTPSFSDHTKFGSALPNSGTAIRTFTIQNTGAASLTVGAISFTGTNHTEFTVTSSPTSPVAASGSTTFTVTFTPTGTGDRNATISIVNNDSDENPYTFSLNGYGYTVKALVVSGITSPTAANGNYISQGVLNNFQYWKHATENYYIFNYLASGVAPAWVIDNDQIGTNGSLFYYNSEAVSPNGLTPWTAQFGTGSPVVSETTPTPEINLVGNNSRNISSGDNSPSRYDGTNFGSLDYSSGSRTRTYTIQNTGTAALTLSGSTPYVSLSGATSDFSVTTAPSNSIAASSSTTFVVTFNPASEGTKTAVVTITNNDSDEGTYTFTIQGDGFTPKNVVLSGVTTPSAFNGTYTHQGLLNEFQYWKYGSYYIYNSDNGGTEDAYWYIDSDTNRSSYYFKSSNNGENGSPVNVTSWTASLGTGSPVIQYAAPEINITGNSVTINDGDASPSIYDYTDFGTIDYNTGTQVYSFTIQNLGTEVLTLSGTSPYVVIGGTNSADFSVTTIPSSSIAASGSTTFGITFNPSAVGSRTATLSIANNDADENPYNFSIQGTGGLTPVVSTQAVSAIATTTATGNGNVTTLGSPNPTAHGVCWNTSGSPTIADSKTDNGAKSSAGAFTAAMTGLSQGTTYYVNSFVTNILGTFYGTATTFKTQNTVSSIVRVNSTLTNATSVQWTVTFAASLTGLTSTNFSLANTGLTTPSFSSVTGSGTTWTVTANTGSGSGTLGLNMANSSGLSTVLSNPTYTGEVYTIDKTAPTVSITSTASSTTNTSPIPVIITFSESVTGFDAADITVGNGTKGALSGSGASYSINITPSGQGAVTVDIAAGVATDAAGNGNTVATQLSRLYDNIPPTVSITSTASNPTNTSPIPVTITFSESVTGFDAGDITVGNGTKGALSGSGASYSINITPSGQVTVTVDIATGVTTDAAGNGNTVATQLSRTYDSVAPTVSITSTASSTTNTSPIPVTITFSESVTGFDAGDITVGNGTKGALSGNGASYSINITPSGQGAVTVDIAAGVATDAAGNGNTVATQLSRTYDNVAPTVSITSSASSTTNTSPIPVTITFSESVTGFDAGDITVGNGTKGSLGGSGTTYTIDITPSGQGAVTVDIAAGVATDGAGNGNTVATQLSRTYDSVAPTVSSINRQTPSEESTLETSVLFRVTFSEPVNNVDINDFSLTITGASSTISSVSSSTGTTIDVLVSNISGYSTIRLDLKSGGTGITDAASNAISGGFTTGQTYTTLTAGTWTGATNINWATASNWAGGSVPISTSDVIIPDVTNDPVIGATSTADCHDLTVNSGASLTIESSGSGTGSLIVTGTPTGNVTCQSYMTADVWHMVSSPVSGQTIASFLAANSLIAVKSESDTRAMKNYLEATDAWSDYFTNSTSGSMGGGKGFSVFVRATTGGTVNYTGALQTGDVDLAITRTASTGFGWNLIGNPYSSAIAINSAAGADNFINNNSSALNQNYCGIYYWNGSAYVPVNLSDGAFYAQVGQGFFVKSKTGEGTIGFTPALQTHRPTAEFKNAVIPWPEIKLVATLGDISNNTVIRFNDAMNQGLDVGYDAGIMKSGFDVYTKLVDDNGVDFGIQCLPLTANSDMIIPIGLESNTKGTVALSVDINNLPYDCQVTFEDRETGMFTPVNKSSQVANIQVAAKSKVVGRFFLHTSYLKNTTGITSLPEDWRIYVAHGQICISGSVTGNATAAIYDLLGRKVGTYQLQNGSLNHIPCSDFRNGVYLISIRQQRGTFTKKISVIN